MAPENALNKKGGKSSRFSRFINENIFDEVNDILQKYKSIIGISNENNMEKSK